MSQVMQAIPFKQESRGVSNASSFISLLREKDIDLKVLALNQLLSVVDYQWSDISGALELIQEISEDKNFPEKQMASYLCSKVYYHLGDMDAALNQALLSITYFNLEVRSQYNECLISHCIDQYIKHRQSPGGEFDKKKEELVVKIIQSSATQGNLFSAIGVSLDCERLDLVEALIKKIPALQIVQVLQLVSTVQRGEFRVSVLKKCVEVMQQESSDLQAEDWSNFIAVLVKLGECNRVAEILWQLLEQDRCCLAFQIAVDLSENEMPQFLNQLTALLPVEESMKSKRDKLVLILSGDVQRKATMAFLQENNQTDPHILTQIKQATDPKYSVPHGAALMSLAIMQTGTQDAEFLKNNIEWATKCNYWQRFTTTATLGMIYKGNYEKYNEILAPYMPQSGGSQGSTNVFENGGAFYALGLIHQSTRKEEVIQKLTEAIRNPLLSKSEQVVHGACLGLGLVSLASEDQNVSDLLKEVLFKNESIYGEAAALSIGLVYAGSANVELVQELLQFSRQSDKEKIIRQLGTAIAIIMFGQEEKADGFIDQMLQDSEPYVRFGGCLTLAMAYVGTASNKVIQRLLNQAVNDVSDDVRRISIIALAFVMFKNYEQIPKVMRLLILSYNPHIRYGTAMALGIACAGTMYQEAINMLEPMLSDNTDFVRQGALIAMSMVMMQANGNCEPKFEGFKKTISELQAKKHETVLVKLGVYLSQGILDAGGRNLVIQLQSKQGFPKLTSCIGMLLFTNYWYWFPMLPFFSLALHPTALIGITQNLSVPKNFTFQSNSKPSQFGYPPHIKADEKKVQEKKTATLSTTNKVKARQVRREAERQGLGESSVFSLKNGESQMSLEQAPSTQGLHKHHSSLLQNPAEDANKIKEEAAPKQEETSVTNCKNASRVLEKQKKFIQYLPDQRYEPLFKERKQGIILLVDNSPNDPEDVIELFIKPKPKVIVQEQIQLQQPQYTQLEEENPPEEFIFDENKQNEKQ